MSDHPCCQRSTHAVLPPTLLRRGLHGVRWVLPTVGLTLIPKCPACVAAYVAAGTGIGISMPTAGFLRTSMIVLCVGSLFYLTLRQVMSRLRPTAIASTTPPQRQ